MQDVKIATSALILVLGCGGSQVGDSQPAPESSAGAPTSLADSDPQVPMSTSPDRGCPVVDHPTEDHRFVPNIDVAALGCHLYRVGRSVSRFDVVTGQWEAVASRGGGGFHPGVASDGERLYAIGGGNTPFRGTLTVESYDPATDRWTPLPSLPSEASPEGGLMGVVAFFHDGHLYAFGGEWRGGSLHAPRGAISRSAFVLDLERRRWNPLPPMPEPMAYGHAVWFQERIWLVGGSDEGGTNRPNARVLSYEPTTQQWRTERRLRRSGNAGAVVHGGRIYAFSSIEIGRSGRLGPQVYDPSTREWSLTGERDITQMGRFVDGAVLVHDSIIVLSTDMRARAHRVFHYQPDSDLWTRL